MTFVHYISVTLVIPVMFVSENFLEGVKVLRHFVYTYASYLIMTGHTLISIHHNNSYTSNAANTSLILYNIHI